MPLYLTDKYIWDFWTIKQVDLYHIFYLQAARTPHNPDLRHDCASVGHAVSYDLVHWELMPDALQPGQPGSWDDRAIWTGCVVEQDNLFYMFYTSSSHTDEGKVQHIGLATSGDLISWERHPDNPLIDASPEWYEKIGDPGVSQEAWRDPYIVYDQESDYYYAFICARVNYGPSDGRGSIGLARSSDLIKWDVMPPVYAGGEFTYMEVPQVVPFEGRYNLIFCVGSEWHSAARRARLSDPAAYLCGTYALVSDRITGDYTLTNDSGLLADLDGTYYAGKIVFNPIGEPTILATRQYKNSRQYYGALIDPMKVGYNSQGYLRLINHS